MNTRQPSKIYQELITWLGFLHYFSCFIDSNLVIFYRISEEEYVTAIKEEIRKVVELQEQLDIDVLVHGEPEVSSHLHLRTNICL